MGIVKKSLTQCEQRICIFHVSFVASPVSGQTSSDNSACNVESSAVSSSNTLDRLQKIVENTGTTDTQHVIESVTASLPQAFNNDIHKGYSENTSKDKQGAIGDVSTTSQSPFTDNINANFSKENSVTDNLNIYDSRVGTSVISCNDSDGYNKEEAVACNMLEGTGKMTVSHSAVGHNSHRDINYSKETNLSSNVNNEDMRRVLHDDIALGHSSGTASLSSVENAVNIDKLGSVIMCERTSPSPVLVSGSNVQDEGKTASQTPPVSCVQPDSGKTCVDVMDITGELPVMSENMGGVKENVNKTSALGNHSGRVTVEDTENVVSHSNIVSSSDSCTKNGDDKLASRGVVADSSCQNSVLKDKPTSESSRSHQVTVTGSVTASISSSHPSSFVSAVDRSSSKSSNTTGISLSEASSTSVSSAQAVSESSNSAEVVSVLVTKDRLQTVHCVGGSLTEMLSYNIENVPDSSGNEASEVTGTGESGGNENASNVTSSFSVDTEAESVHVNSPGAGQVRSESADTTVTSKEPVACTAKTAAESSETTEISKVSTSNVNAAQSERRERKTFEEIVDNAMKRRQKELELTSERVQNLFEQTPVLMQCLGVDRPAVISSRSGATTSSCVQLDKTGNITSSLTDIKASTGIGHNSVERGQNSKKQTDVGQDKSNNHQDSESSMSGYRSQSPFLVITPAATSRDSEHSSTMNALGSSSGLDRPFVIASVGEQVLSPGSVRSSNPSPAGSTCSNQTNHSPPAPITKKQTNTVRENKRKRKNPTRSQNYNTTSATTEVTAQSENHKMMKHSSRKSSREDASTLPVQVKCEKPDSSGVAPSIHNILPHVPPQEALPRISNVQSLHPGLIPNIPQAGPRPRAQRTSRPRSKANNKETVNIRPGHSQNFSNNQSNMYSASNLMTHFNERVTMRSIRPVSDYYPPINITPENAPPPPPGFPPPYNMPGGPLRMSMPYMPPPPPPMPYGSQPGMQGDRPIVHLERGAIRIERPSISMNRNSGSLERHNMLQTTRPPFSSPFIDIGPQVGNVYYSDPQGLMLPQQHRPPRTPLVIRPDCSAPINIQKPPNTSPNEALQQQQQQQSALKKPPAPASIPQQLPANRTRVITPETSKGKSSSVIFIPPKVISEGSKTNVSKTVKIAPKKSVSTTTTSVIVKTSISASTSVSAASRTAISDPDPTRISSDILKEQQVKTYKPEQPPEHLGFKEALKTNKCQGCGDEFLFGSSLVNHLDRKSVVIKYNCSECNKTIVFYNRCCLFIHAKGHAKGAKAYRLNINLATINVLPDDLIPSKLSISKEREMLKRNKTEKFQENVKSAVSEGSKSLEASSPQKTSPDKVISPKQKPSPAVLPYNPNFSVTPKLNKAMYNCTECSKSYLTTTALQNHFLGKATKNMSFYKCSKCLTDVIGDCASKAHMRIHSKEQPYVCPECGELISGNRDIFLKHLKQKCMHFQRTCLLRCKICNSILLFDAEIVSAHYNEHHSLKYYKCLECPMAFKTEATYRNHQETKHDRKGDHKLICKCALCDTVFHQVCNIESHFKLEHWPQLMKSCFTAYKCLSCVPKKVFNDRSGYIYHATNVHGNRTVIEMCNECGEEFKTTDAMKMHRKEVHKDFDNVEQANTEPGKCVINSDQISKESENNEALSDTNQTGKGDVICTKCNTTLGDQETYEKHMEKHKFVVKRKLVGPQMPSVKVKKLKIQETENSIIVSQKKSPLSKTDKNSKTKEKSISPKPAAEFIGQVPTAPTPIPRKKCSECPARFTGAEELQEHLKISHGISPQYPCHLCGNTYESQIMVERHLQMTHEGKSKDHPYLCWLCLDGNVIKGYGSWKMLEKHLMNQHKLHKNNIDYSRFPKELIKEEVADTESVSSRRSSLELDDQPVKRFVYHYYHRDQSMGFEFYLKI